MITNHYVEAKPKEPKASIGLPADDAPRDLVKRLG